MNTTLAIILISWLLITLAISTLKYHKTRIGRERKPNIPFLMGLLVGPLHYFLMVIAQRKERRQFMEGRRRFS